jgi:hypothetical protein
VSTGIKNTIGSSYQIFRVSTLCTARPGGFYPLAVPFKSSQSRNSELKKPGNEGFGGFLSHFLH